MNRVGDVGLRSGVVYWVTGLAGSGKTTIGSGLCRHLRDAGQPVIFLDGDVLRKVFGDDLGYGPEDRRKSAMRNSRLCRLLSDQGMDVVCATISMFRSCRNWNRANIRHYVEIFVRVPVEVLIARDQKQLYSKAIRGEVEHVMGLDLPVEIPEEPDLIVDNDGSAAPDVVVSDLVEAVRNLKIT